MFYSLFVFTGNNWKKTGSSDIIRRSYTFLNSQQPCIFVRLRFQIKNIYKNNTFVNNIDKQQFLRRLKKITSVFLKIPIFILKLCDIHSLSIKSNNVFQLFKWWIFESIKHSNTYYIIQIWYKLFLWYKIFA